MENGSGSSVRPLVDTEPIHFYDAKVIINKQINNPLMLILAKYIVHDDYFCCL